MQAFFLDKIFFRRALSVCMCEKMCLMLTQVDCCKKEIPKAETDETVKVYISLIDHVSCIVQSYYF